MGDTVLPTCSTFLPPLSLHREKPPSISSWHTCSRFTRYCNYPAVLSYLSSDATYHSTSKNCAVSILGEAFSFHGCAADLHVDGKLLERGLLCACPRLTEVPNGDAEAAAEPRHGHSQVLTLTPRPAPSEASVSRGIVAGQQTADLCRQPGVFQESEESRAARELPKLPRLLGTETRDLLCLFRKLLGLRGFLEMNHSLCWLGVAKNKLRKISGLTNLSSLAVLDISDNKVTRPCLRSLCLCQGVERLPPAPGWLAWEVCRASRHSSPREIALPS